MDAILALSSGCSYQGVARNYVEKHSHTFVLSLDIVCSCISLFRDQEYHPYLACRGPAPSMKERASLQGGPRVSRAPHLTLRQRCHNVCGVLASCVKLRSCLPPLRCPPPLLIRMASQTRLPRALVCWTYPLSSYDKQSSFYRTISPLTNNLQHIQTTFRALR